MPWRAHQLVDERDKTTDHRIVGREACLANPFSCDVAAIPPCEHAGEPIDLRGLKTERAPDIAHCAFRPIGDEGCGERRTIAAVLVVNVLHNVFAPLMLE